MCDKDCAVRSCIAKEGEALLLGSEVRAAPPSLSGNYATRQVYGMPSRAIVLRTLHASCTSTRWLSKVRYLNYGPRIDLYPHVVFPTRLRLL